MIRLDADLSLSFIIRKLKGVYFLNTKKTVLEALLELTKSYTAYGLNHRVVLNRHKAHRAKENPSKDPDALKSIFGQIFTQVFLF